MTVPHPDFPTQPPSAPTETGGTTLCPDPAAAPGPAPETCPGCGATSRPTLLAGVGPHACKAVCSACGRFLRWVSLLAPSERLARKMKARLTAMQQHPASAAQLALLLALGDTQAAPTSMAAASERIEALRQKGGRS